MSTIAGILFSLFLIVSGIVWMTWASRKAPRAFANINLPGGSGLAANGSLLYCGNGLSPQVYLIIGNLANVKWNLKNITADTSNMGLNWKQHITTMHDGGTVTFDIHALPNSAGIDGASTGLQGDSFATGLGSIFVTGAIRQWKEVFSDGTAEFFDATITDFAYDLANDKDILLHVTLMVTGQPTLA